MWQVLLSCMEMLSIRNFVSLSFSPLSPVDRCWWMFYELSICGHYQSCLNASVLRHGLNVSRCAWLFKFIVHSIHEMKYLNYSLKPTGSKKSTEFLRKYLFLWVHKFVNKHYVSVCNRLNFFYIYYNFLY
jgi:hypothetical protein